MQDAAHRAVSQPWAQVLQADTEPVDLSMAEQARYLHPTVRWWWGVRSTRTGKYAQCYLCGAIVTTWASRWPMPERSRQHLLEHRHTHAVRQALTTATHAPGDTGGDGTPEGAHP